MKELSFRSVMTCAELGLLFLKRLPQFFSLNSLRAMRANREKRFLDLFFGNVCELALVFNFHKVYVIVDEFFLAGEVQETSKKVMLDRLQLLEKAD